MANGFIFKAGLDPNIQDPLSAYTLGKNRQTWLSREARSLSDLVVNTETKTKAADPLLLLVAHSSGLKGRLAKREPKYEHLKIYLYAGANQNTETTTFVFYKFEQVGEPEAYDNGLLLVTFKYGSMQVFGSKA